MNKPNAEATDKLDVIPAPEDEDSLKRSQI
jgi:hypothetical protein